MSDGIDFNSDRKYYSLENIIKISVKGNYIVGSPNQHYNHKNVFKTLLNSPGEDQSQKVTRGHVANITLHMKPNRYLSLFFY